MKAEDVDVGDGLLIRAARDRAPRVPGVNVSSEDRRPSTLGRTDDALSARVVGAALAWAAASHVSPTAELVARARLLEATLTLEAHRS